MWCKRRVGGSLAVFTCTMAFITVLFAVLAVGVVAEEKLPSTEVPKRSDLRIVRGQDAQEGQFPWQAWVECILPTLVATGCGGSLISNSHVITAAHCVNSVLLCQVSLGLTSLNDRGYSYFIRSSDLTVHEKYRADAHVNDIAIIRLRSPIKLTENIQPIRLPKEFQNSKTLSGEPAIISGWGKTRDDENGIHDRLQYAVEIIMPQTECKILYLLSFGLQITDGHICTDFSRSNVCSGDSGGPLTILEKDGNPTLVGITSFGVSPCEEGMPAVFTAVAAYLPWIKQNMQK